ncbi:MAG TPA: hypothetical protein DHW34_02480 [Actinobacteria bacterium]|nr:hypothetical protein [Actinomycetota bacterium]
MDKALLRSRTARTLTALTALLLAATLTTACSSKSSGPSGSGGSAVSGGLGGDDASPGVTADSIKVGFLISDIGKVAASLGFKQANYGGAEGQTKQIQAVVDYVNANGGLGGRKLVPVIKVYDGSQDSPEYAESFCNALTQDDQVFAVVFEGQLQNNVRPCYASRKTIMIDQGLLAKDQAEFERFSPYLWSATFPEYGSFLKGQLQALQSQNWFAGSKGVSVIALDGDVGRRQAAQTVIPFLASQGITNYKEFFIDTSNVGTLGAGSSTALTGTKNAGLNRIIVVGGARILPIAVTTPEAGDLDATTKWSISSFDSTVFLQDNPDSVVSSTLQGMLGVGFIPAGDVGNNQLLPFPDPANPAQVLCKQIIDNAGATPPEGIRTNYKAGFQYCDGALFLKAVIAKAPKDLTAAKFRDAAWSLQTTDYRSSLAFNGSFSTGRYAYDSTVRVLGWDNNCDNPTTKSKGCFVYQGGDLTLQ